MTDSQHTALLLAARIKEYSDAGLHVVIAYGDTAVEDSLAGIDIQPNTIILHCKNDRHSAGMNDMANWHVYNSNDLNLPQARKNDDAIAARTLTPSFIEKTKPHVLRGCGKAQAAKNKPFTKKHR